MVWGTLSTGRVLFFTIVRSVKRSGVNIWRGVAGRGGGRCRGGRRCVASESHSEGIQVRSAGCYKLSPEEVDVIRIGSGSRSRNGGEMMVCYQGGRITTG